MKALEDIRQNRALDEGLLKALNQYPLIDKLQEFVEESDIPRLMKMAADTGVDFVLAVSLLRKFDTRADVKSFFLEQWNQLNDLDHKLELMWRILDDEALDLSVHEDVYTFVRSNMERFVKESVDWYGGVDRVLDVVRSRLSDPSFPRTKDWAYLCTATGSSDRSAATELVRSYAASKNSFLRKVVKEILHYLDEKYL